MTVPSAEVRPRIMEKPRESPTAWPMAFTDSQGRTSYVPFAQRALEERWWKECAVSYCISMRSFQRINGHQQMRCGCLPHFFFPLFFFFGSFFCSVSPFWFDFSCKLQRQCGRHDTGKDGQGRVRSSTAQQLISYIRGRRARRQYPSQRQKGTP